MTILSQVSQNPDLTVGYVYQWSNNINGKKYIGSHCGNNPWYMTSGIAIKNAFKKYGIENFTRIIIYVGPQYRTVEEDILTALDVRNTKHFYNQTNSSCGYEVGHQHSEETKKKLSEKALQKPPASASLRKKRSENAAGSNNSMYGKSFSKEHRNNISAGLKNNSGKSNHTRWHTHRNIISLTCIHCQAATA